MVSNFASGLAQIKAEKAKREALAEERNRPKASYFNWKHNKGQEPNTVYVRFLQEWDKDVPGFDESRGLPVMQVEHQAPGKEGYRRRANCTREEGQCYACERNVEAPRIGWAQKSNFYTWALVDYEDGEGPVPRVLSRSFGSSFVDDLIYEVENSEDNKITDKMYKITRTGSGKQTAWKLREAKGVELYDDTDVSLLDLKSSVLRDIPYEEQAAYYGAVYKDGDPLDHDDDESVEEKPKRQASGELNW